MANGQKGKHSTLYFIFDLWKLSIVYLYSVYLMMSTRSHKSQFTCISSGLLYVNENSGLK